jgi:hypothetical protein
MKIENHDFRLLTWLAQLTIFPEFSLEVKRSETEAKKKEAK